MAHNMTTSYHLSIEKQAFPLPSGAQMQAGMTAIKNVGGRVASKLKSRGGKTLEGGRKLLKGRRNVVKNINTMRSQGGQTAAAAENVAANQMKTLKAHNQKLMSEEGGSFAQRFARNRQMKKTTKLMGEVQPKTAPAAASAPAAAAGEGATAAAKPGKKKLIGGAVLGGGLLGGGYLAGAGGAKEQSRYNQYYQ